MAASADLSSLLNQSKALTSHLSRPDLPSVHLSLDQVEALSRRLVARQPVTESDNDRANYLLAQAQIDAPALSHSIAHLNANTTFSPRTALADTDIAGYIRAAHEQSVIASIEAGRKGTQADFYHLLDERAEKDWEERKRRIVETLGSKLGGDTSAFTAGGKRKGSQLHATTTTPILTPQVQAKMLAYAGTITELNNARLRGTSYPIVHGLLRSALNTSNDPLSAQMTQTFHVLSKITQEPPSLPPTEHQSAHILNTPLLARKYARAYLSTSSPAPAPTTSAFGSSSFLTVSALGSSSRAPLRNNTAVSNNSPEAVALRTQIAKGAREALEEQYWDAVQRTLEARAQEAQVGGDPSAGNLVRAFVLLRHWRNGEWEDRIELVGGQPVWAKLWYLVRTGHTQEALQEVVKSQRAIDGREPGFVTLFRAWIEAPDRRLPRAAKEQAQAAYTNLMLSASEADPFRIALIKLIGKIEPGRRSVQGVTNSTEDWLWFQLAMVDEQEAGGLQALADVLLGYGERHFEGEATATTKPRRGVWAGVLLMCGQFERAVAALWEHSETEVEAVHLAIALAYHGLLRVASKGEASDMVALSTPQNAPPALNLAPMIWRYVRAFVKMDAKEALGYVCTVALSSDAPAPVGPEQVEAAWELVRRIVVLANPGAAWEELVGGFRADGTRFPGMIEQGAALLNLHDGAQFNEEILGRAAQAAEAADRLPEAIKLYNLAGAYSVVVSVLANALGTALARGGAGTQDERARAIEGTAKDIVRHYERTNRAPGRERETVVRLLRIREAMDAKAAGRLDVALDIIESTQLVPLDGDVGKIGRRADEFKGLHEALQRNLQTYVTLTMDVLAGLHQRIKTSGGASTDPNKQLALNALRQKSRSLLVFAGGLKYRMPPDVYAYCARLDVEINL